MTARIMKSTYMRLMATCTAAFLSLTIIAACGDDSTVSGPESEPATPMLTLPFGGGFGSYADSLESVTYKVGYGQNGNSPELVVVDLTTAESGDKNIFTAGNSQVFLEFVELLTNGIDDQLYRATQVTAFDGGMKIGGGQLESLLFEGRLGSTTYPDLADTTIVRIEVEFSNVDVRIPGSDLRGDGNWVDVDFRGEIRIY
jgi:hypothetical protein